MRKLTKLQIILLSVLGIGYLGCGLMMSNSEGHRKVLYLAIGLIYLIALFFWVWRGKSESKNGDVNEDQNM